MVFASVYCSGGYQFDAPEKPIFDSRITKFIFRSSGDLNFMILVEDCDTGGPSSMTVRMEYLLGFQFSYYELCVETDGGKAGNFIFLIFVLWGCFNCRWVRVEAESLI